MAAKMILFPAIDLKDGACVRLVQGDMARATVFGTDPAAQAGRFAELGFDWLHVVDLNGAFAGRPVNGAAIDAILAVGRLKLQLGGGIRDLSGIESWLERGVERVVLGTAALRDPALVRDAARRFPGRIAVAIDARDGRVAVAGWAEQTEIDAGDLARALDNAGLAAFIYTDIARDGVLAGLDVEATAALARSLSTPVIASGGVASVDDLRRLKRVAADGVIGVIAGRALYDGRLDARAALAVLAE